MRSAAKLSYEQAQLAISGRPDEDVEHIVTPVLEPLYAAYRATLKARSERAPLDLDLPERKIQLDEPIKTTGSHMVTVEVHDGVTATIKTIVTAG